MGMPRWEAILDGETVEMMHHALSLLRVCFRASMRSHRCRRRTSTWPLILLSHHACCPPHSRARVGGHVLLVALVGCVVVSMISFSSGRCACPGRLCMYPAALPCSACLQCARELAGVRAASPVGQHPACGANMQQQARLDANRRVKTQVWRSASPGSMCVPHIFIPAAALRMPHAG